MENLEGPPSTHYISKSPTPVLNVWEHFSRFIREYLGFYDFSEEETARFNPTILPNYYRFKADFARMCDEEPDKPTDGADNDPKNESIVKAPKPCPERARKELQLLIDAIEENVWRCRRADLYAMESYLIAASTPSYLLQAYPSLQDRYRSLAGPDAYRRYESGIRPDLKSASVDDSSIRADALFLLSESRRLSIAIPRREHLRGILLSTVLGIGLIAVSILCYFMFYRPIYHPLKHFPYLLTVSLFALFGGVISVSRRLQALPEEDLNLAQWGRTSLLLSPLTSMGFGIVLYYIFAGGLINGPNAALAGTIFPDVSKIEGSCVAGCKDLEKKAPVLQNRGGTLPPAAAVKPKAVRPAQRNLPDKASSPVKTPPAVSSTPPVKDSDECVRRSEKSVCFLHEYGGSVVEWMKTFDYIQFAKLLVWAFLAGFAEQLVPDTLDSLVKRQAGTKAAS